MFRATTPTEKLLTLQRTHGNTFVQRVIQCKLSVSHPDDPYEREADRVADAVVRTTDSRSPTSPVVDRQQEPDAAVQRMCSDCEEEVGRQAMPEEEEEEQLQTRAAPGGTAEVSEQVESSIQNLRGGGQPLPGKVRADMESRMGYDFSAVRVHADAHAHDLARSVNALAFTHGGNVVFGGGQFRPDTESGKRLLAHELTHVVQQTGAGGPVRRRTPSEKVESGS